MNLADIYQYAEENDIVVYTRKHTRRKAFCVVHDGIQAISIDNAKISGSREELTVLAEEIGHIQFHALYTLSECCSPLARQNIAKAEYQARCYGARLCVPPSALRPLLHLTSWEIAETLDLPQDMVEFATTYYRSTGEV